MTRKLTTASADAGLGLAAWLALRLTLSPDAAVMLVLGGSVYLDGKRARDPLARLRAGQKVQVHEPRSLPPTAWRVAHEDADVLVVDKPAGLAVQATREQAGALDEQVQARWPAARLLHRIDQDTSGLVLFTLAPAARPRLQAALAGGAIAREYLAVVAGAPSRDAFELDAPVAGQEARSRVAVARRGGDTTLLRCALVTGRNHQLRIHLAGAGLPILGDRQHAPPAVAARAPRLALHATRLAWPGGAVESPLPEELAPWCRDVLPSPGHQRCAPPHA